MCTVHSFPHNIDHCLTFARSEFEGHLEKAPAEANAFLQQPASYVQVLPDQISLLLPCRASFHHLPTVFPLRHTVFIISSLSSIPAMLHACRDAFLSDHSSFLIVMTHQVHQHAAVVRSKVCQSCKQACSVQSVVKPVHTGDMYNVDTCVT